MASSSNVPICTHFQRGFCSFGQRCHNLHPRYSQYQHKEKRHFSQSNKYYGNHYSLNRRAPKHPSYTSNKENNFNDNTSNHHSAYSSLHPTNKKQEHMDKFIDYDKETLIFDIDGTIADIEHRLALSPGTKSDGTRTTQEWNVVLDGSNYKYDRVIPVAWAYLKHIEAMNKYNIIYLSGRRAKTVKDTIAWLFDEHHYPKGLVIHRIKGMSGQQFKQQQLIKLQSKIKIAAYFGDRIIDDCIVSIKAGVRPLLVVPNEWLFAKHIYGGIGAVISDILEHNECMLSECKRDNKMYAAAYWQTKRIPEGFIQIAKESEFWNMSYADLVPLDFATEMFDDGNRDLLPPECLLKIKKNGEEYWNNVIDESKKVMLENKNENKNIESCHSGFERAVGSKIKFYYDKQKYVQPKHRWIPCGQN